MTYSPTWSNGTDGRLSAGVHVISLTDGTEVAEAINRRRLLIGHDEEDFSSHLASGKYVKAATLATITEPFENLREALDDTILTPGIGFLGGGCVSAPSDFAWLWPVADGNENDELTRVLLFSKLNGGDDWTDPTPTAGQTGIKAVHFNELRQVVEWIRRGRWEADIYFFGGIFSAAPDSTWAPWSVANNGTHELRSVGCTSIRNDETPPRGLTNLTVRSSSKIRITVDTACSLGVYHCLRDVPCSEETGPTWNEYDWAAGKAWAAPGGLGPGDSSYIGSMSGLGAGETGEISGEDVASAFQDMVDGAEQNFLVRRTDTGPETITITGEIIVEFDLDTPPN